MENPFFQQVETAKSGSAISFSKLVEQLAFNNNCLIPVIAQDVNSKEVLMMAWMNLDALHKTLETRLMTYWSRSRDQLWVKGETSGHHQRLVELRFDCDGDSVLCLVEQAGVACHTGRQNCFYLKVMEDRKIVTLI